MMNSQTYSPLGAASQMLLAAGRPAVLARGEGELTVLTGRVWMTRHGDLDDHVLERGDRVRIGWADRAVLESWERDLSATVQWRAIERPVASQARAGLLRGLAFVASGVAFALARAEAGFAALARSAASSARRAQGCIS